MKEGKFITETGGVAAAPCNTSGKLTTFKAIHSTHCHWHSQHTLFLE